MDQCTTAHIVLAYITRYTEGAVLLDVPRSGSHGQCVYGLEQSSGLGEQKLWKLFLN